MHKVFRVAIFFGVWAVLYAIQNDLLYKLYKAKTIPKLGELPHEIIKEGKLLSWHGGIREPGWSRSLLLKYDRWNIRSPAVFVKEWDYYGILTDSFGVALTVGDLGYACTLSASILDGFDSRHSNKNKRGVYEHTDTLITPSLGGKWRLPEDSRSGRTYGKIGASSMEFTTTTSPDGSTIERKLVVHWDDFGAKDSERFTKRFGGVGLTCFIKLYEAVSDDTIVVATPFTESHRYFYYNQKSNCLNASGVVMVGSTKLDLTPGEAWGVLDWGRGVWAYSTSWVWSSASGLATLKNASAEKEEEEGAVSKNNAVFGLNFGHGFGDLTTHSENCVFVNGVLHKFGVLNITYNKENYLEKWTVKDAEGKVDLVMTPVYDRYAPTEFVVVSMVAHQVFGSWSGTVTLEDGSVVTVNDVMGWSEFVANRW